MSGSGWPEVAARAVERARRERRERWLAVQRRGDDGADPLDALTAQGDAFYYALPEAGLAIGARGAAAGVEVSGAGRFAVARAGVGELAQRLECVGTPAPPGFGPLWVGGFAFGDGAPRDAAWQGFPPGRWWLPGLLTVARGDELWHTELVPVTPADAPEALAARLRNAAQDPPRASAAPAALPDCAAVRLEADGGPADHRARVERALGAIARGELEKVVLARALDVAREAAFDVPALVRELRERHRGCAIFALRRAGVCFVGATPERLLRLRGRRVEATALAGSAPRGRSPAEDAALRRALVESKKEQSEHAVAVRALRAALEDCGASLRVPEAPEVQGLAGVQHLCTRIVGELPGDAADLFALAARVHPSAAVAGTPTDAALAWLAENEPLDRGWYAGLVGWRDLAGGGELSAALRCARIEGARARLYAGGGIVAGSEPDAELRETRLKWNALLPALLEL